MKLRNRIIILILTASVFACAKPSVTPPSPVLADRGGELFERAEQLYQSGAYEAALKAYQTYLFNYPQQLYAPAAIDRQGEIYFTLGKINKAKEAYQHLIKEYPNSPLTAKARLGLIRSLFREGSYPQVITLASGIDISRLSRLQTYEYFNLLGGSHEKLKDPKKAIYYYSLSLESASDGEKEDIRKKLKATIALLSPETISALIEQTDDKETKGYLSIQLIQNMIYLEKNEEAIAHLSDFVEKYPGHPEASRALELKVELEKRLRSTLKIPEFRRYTVGCILPLSGSYEIYGQRAMRGIEIAMNEFNSDEMNPSITVLVKDTGSDPDRALKAVEELNNDEVTAIIGPITAVVPAAFAAQDLGLPIMTLTQKDDITIIGNYVFRNFITPRMQVAALVKYITTDLGLERVAILYPNDNYGRTHMNLFWDEIIAHDAKVVGVESYDPSSMDFADPIKKLVGLFYEIPEDLKPKPFFTPDSDSELKPDEDPEPEEPKPIVDFDAIFIPDADKKAGLIIPQLVYNDIEDVYLLGTNLWHSEKLIDMAGQYAQGAIIADGFFAASKSDKIKEFTARFQTAYGKQPEFIEAIAYDNAMMLFQSLKNPEIESREMLRDELLKIAGYPGITGLTSFDENGDAIKQLYLLQVRKDRFVEVNRGR